MQAKLSGLIVVAWIMCWPGGDAAAQPERVTTTYEMGTLVTLRDVRPGSEMVSGTIVNHSHRALRDVRILIRHAWMWRDERNPGYDNPGRTDTYVVPDEVPAGGTHTFTHIVSPPLPNRHDGRFKTTVEIVGFTEVGF